METKTKAVWTQPNLQKLALKDAEAGSTNTNAADLLTSYS